MICARNRVIDLSACLDPDRRWGAPDADWRAAGAPPLPGLPVRSVIDDQGCAIAYLTGAADWDSAALGPLQYFIDKAGH